MWCNQLTAEVTYALAERDDARFVRVLADFSGGHPSSPVCFGDRTQPNAVGGRDLWREHGAESENACPAHVEPKPRVGAFCLIVTHARCPAAHAPRAAT